MAPRTCEDAIYTANELEISATVLDNEESRARRHSIAMRLTDGHIPLALCARTGQTSASFVVPALCRPVVGAEVIEMLRGLLQPSLTRAAASAIYPLGSSTRRTNSAASEGAPPKRFNRQSSM